MNSSKIEWACILLGGILICLISCVSRYSNDKAFTIQVNGIGFDCRLPQVLGDTMRLTPIIMYIDIEVINNTDETQVLGSYNHRFDQENRKYGYFTLIDGQDTICLYSNYSSLFEIEPRQSVSMQLHYEGFELLGNNQFLKKLSIVWIGDEQLRSENICMSDVEFIQRFIDSLQMGYISFDSNSFDKANFDTQISPEMLFVDYNYSDESAFEMRKSPSGWELDFENTNR